MLRYLSSGQRSFGDTPMPLHARVNWEFYAILRGRAAPILKGNESPALASERLWVFPPGHVHGWCGESGRECSVVVMHFSSVPTALERLVSERGYITVPLTKGEARTIERIGRSLSKHYWHPMLVSSVVCERALMDLALILLRHAPESSDSAEAGVSLNRVIEAENWLRRRLGESPSISGAATQVGLSPSQLRRLFWRVRKKTPKQILNRLRFERAMSLMAETDAKLQWIAHQCGFANATSFCRAFQRFNGFSPTAWRKEIYVQYKRPRASEGTDHTRHGSRRRLL